ncbi:MAG: hypothetical protein KZQ72_13305, partial [Candidatus Thiodiazotropha sp. (ex Cardiolucina cf. quadrata)]|nr:hypothetical protein [Candidatus Thiodiazotropha sp. (ex Cardiolucina cf. quadrata)]
RKARRVYSLASRLPGTNRLGFQPSMALSDRSHLRGCPKYGVHFSVPFNRLIQYNRTSLSI